jgi:nuclear transport factor 2 (NTF2) superfamily protein
MPDEKPPVPPFTRETAAKKVQAAEDAWNTRDAERVALAYTEDSVGASSTKATTATASGGVATATSSGSSTSTD